MCSPVFLVVVVFVVLLVLGGFGIWGGKQLSLGTRMLYKEKCSCKKGLEAAPCLFCTLFRYVPNEP